MAYEWNRVDYGHYKLNCNTLEKADIKVYDYQYSEMNKIFNILGCKLNPEKYSKEYISINKINHSNNTNNSNNINHSNNTNNSNNINHSNNTNNSNNINNINLMEFCYYVSNILVCLSHDIIYAISKELNKLPDYNDKNKIGKTLKNNKINKISNYNNESNKAKIQNNIHNIVVTSFNCIMEALTSLKSGMFFIEILSYDYNKNTYNEFQEHFRGISSIIHNCEEYFNELLKNIESDITKTELSKLTELINKIKDYKKSNKFQDKLCEAVKKDKNLSIKEKHHNIQICYDKFNKEFPPKKVLYYYDKSYNEFPSEKVYSSFMSNNGEINEKLVQDISNKNIDDIGDIVLN